MFLVIPGLVLGLSINRQQDLGFLKIADFTTRIKSMNGSSLGFLKIAVLDWLDPFMLFLLVVLSNQTF